MWMLKNETPFAAERSFARDIRGAQVWLVAVKGTFSIGPDGSTKIAAVQEDVCRAPQLTGEPGRSSLRYESDLVLTKRTTDVLLHGNAHAPRGEPAPQVDVMLKIAGLTKVVRVFGDRRWKRSAVGLSPTRPEAFLTMPITYERAFGGIDRSPQASAARGWERRNPVGVGFALEEDHLVDTPLPNVEDPHDPIASWNHRPRPAGFGPIARRWSPRLELAGTYDESWDNERRPLLPLDFDERFHQCAPGDQQAPKYLRGGEPVELYNLTPDGFLRFTLPTVTIGFLTWIAGEMRPHPARLHTIIIEPERSRLMMVWHTALPCHHDVHRLKWTRVFEKKKIATGDLLFPRRRSS